MKVNTTVPSLQILACNACTNFFSRFIYQTIVKFLKCLPIDVMSLTHLRKLLITVPKSLHNQVSMAFLRAIERNYNRCAPVLQFCYYNTELQRGNILMFFFDIFAELHITRLNFTLIKQTLWDYLYEKLATMTNLEWLYIDVYPVFSKVKEPINVISDSLQNMNNLTSLTFNHFCSDRTVQILSENCKKLKYLNVRYSPEVTNNCVPYLMEFKILQQLEIMDTNINLNGFVDILIGCPSLTNIEQFYNMAEVLEVINSRNSNLVLDILNVKCDNVTTKHLQLISKMCPKVISLEVQSATADFKVLKSLRYIRELAISNASFYRDGVDELLKTVGKSLIVLYFLRMKDLDFNAIISIGTMCPNLEKLIIESCDYTSECCSKIQIIPGYNFRGIIYLELIQKVPKNIFRFLLSCCYNVRTLIMVDLENELCDETIKCILSRNSMNFLKEIYVNSTTYLSLSILEHWANTSRSLKCMLGLNKYGVMVFEDIEELERKYPYLCLDGTYSLPSKRSRYQNSGITLKSM